MTLDKNTPLKFANIKKAKYFTDADEAVAYLQKIYLENIKELKDGFTAFTHNKFTGFEHTPCYPYIGISIGADDINTDPSKSWGTLPSEGNFGTTVSAPDIMGDYYRNQIAELLKNHNQPIVIGESDQPIPITFVIDKVEGTFDSNMVPEMRKHFHLPDLSVISDEISNSTFDKEDEDGVGALALFTGPRIDYSLNRLKHYTGVAPKHFQRFVIFTNYQRYVDEFVAYAAQRIIDGKDDKNSDRELVLPGDIVLNKHNLTSLDDMPEVGKLPQMPSYHFTDEHNMGISLINIGVGPSNAKTITDHVAVIRPHCWIMVGHCGGLRKTQRLGDYVLAHAYVRIDNVLDNDLPPWIPLPTIAEVQVAMAQATGDITGLKGRKMKDRFRTGTVVTTDDRNWELRYKELSTIFNQSRAIAVDMESATIAANGFRFRVPYGTLLCVSDKPVHGEIKLPGMANSFYAESVEQHLKIGIRTLDILRNEVKSESLHSRKLRSFNEPAFR
ncbi:MAG: AMP nucleosidase [OCS116 cluster bacterium]|nr:AMP nucleosidase [OCS116 cluster bacterium]